MLVNPKVKGATMLVPTNYVMNGRFDKAWITYDRGKLIEERSTGRRFKLVRSTVDFFIFEQLAPVQPILEPTLVRK